MAEYRYKWQEPISQEEREKELARQRKRDAACKAYLLRVNATKLGPHIVPFRDLPILTVFRGAGRWCGYEGRIMLKIAEECGELYEGHDDPERVNAILLDMPIFDECGVRDGAARVWIDEDEDAEPLNAELIVREIPGPAPNNTSWTTEGA